LTSQFFQIFWPKNFFGQIDGDNGAEFFKIFENGGDGDGDSFRIGAKDLLGEVRGDKGDGSGYLLACQAI
jgi:hypothetical protein